MDRRTRTPVDVSKLNPNPLLTAPPTLKPGDLTQMLVDAVPHGTSFKSDVVGSTVRRMYEEGTMSEERFQKFLELRRPIIDSEINDPVFVFDSIIPEMRERRHPGDLMLTMGPIPVTQEGAIQITFIKKRSSTQDHGFRIVLPKKHTP